jgi:hypothetical protein
MRTMMIEKEPCPLCDPVDRIECRNCGGSGEVEVPPDGTKPEGAIYNLYCTCGSSQKVFLTENHGPLDMQTLLHRKCSKCGADYQSEMIGWGSEA